MMISRIMKGGGGGGVPLHCSVHEIIVGYSMVFYGIPVNIS